MNMVVVRNVVGIGVGVAVGALILFGCGSPSSPDGAGYTCFVDAHFNNGTVTHDQRQDESASSVAAAQSSCATDFNTLPGFATYRATNGGAILSATTCSCTAK